MGTVTHEQEGIIVNVVRHAASIQKIVNIFQYVDKTTLELPPVVPESE